MRAVNTDFQMELPARRSPASTWSLDDECNIVSTFYNAWYHAMTIAMIRSVGHERTYEIHEAMLRHHQKDYFLPGLKKLGLDKERSDAIRCAKYHCYSNAIGGLRTRYAIESDDKAWLFYYPSSSDNPWPAQGVVIHTERNMTVDYLGWHGNNGTLLGNPGLIFCATHFIASGDPFDGGYFLDTHRAVPAGSKVEIRTGEALPRGLDFEAMQLAPEEWPPVRRAKALRTYAVTWAADRAWTAANGIGAPAVDIVAYALSTMLYAWLPRLWSAFAASSGPRPLDEFADILNGLCSISGLGSRIERDARGVTVAFDKPLADFVASGASAEERRLMDLALRKSWAGLARHFDPDISLEPGSDKAWRFTLAA